MVLYSLALVPLAERLFQAAPNVVQPWHADDFAMTGPVDDIAWVMTLLLHHQPDHG